MPGLEAAITALGERVDSPDVLTASRAAEIALIGSLKAQQQTSPLKVTHLSYHPYHVCNDETNSSLLFPFHSFSSYITSAGGETEESVGELANTSHMPLELVQHVNFLVHPQVLLDGFHTQSLHYPEFHLCLLWTCWKNKRDWKAAV